MSMFSLPPKMLPRAQFYRRLLRHGFYATLLLAVSLGIGMFGYRLFARLSWVDSFYNAAMILTGMGPANEMPDTAAKLFSAAYALFSGIIFLSMVAVLITPVAHRILHLVRLDDK